MWQGNFHREYPYPSITMSVTDTNGYNNTVKIKNCLENGATLLYFNNKNIKAYLLLGLRIKVRAKQPFKT